MDVELLPMAAVNSAAGRPASSVSGSASTRSLSHDGVSAPRQLPASKVTILAHVYFKVCLFLESGLGPMFRKIHSTRLLFVDPFLRCYKHGDLARL